MTPVQQTEIADFITGFASRHGLSRVAAIQMITTPAMSRECERQIALAGFTTEKRAWSAVRGLWHITEYHHSRPKYPWSVQNEQGKCYKMTRAQAESCFKAYTPAPGPLPAPTFIAPIAVTPVTTIQAPPKRVYAGDF
jgi:hypothetical protein